jgi:hypothetical protein
VAAPPSRRWRSRAAQRQALAPGAAQGQRRARRWPAAGCRTLGGVREVPSPFSETLPPREAESLKATIEKLHAQCEQLRKLVEKAPEPIE